MLIELCCNYSLYLAIRSFLKPDVHTGKKRSRCMRRLEIPRIARKTTCNWHLHSCFYIQSCRSKLTVVPKKHSTKKSYRDSRWLSDIICRRIICLSTVSPASRHCMQIFRSKYRMLVHKSYHVHVCNFWLWCVAGTLLCVIRERYC